MEKIRLGKTGMMVTRLGFGGIPIQRLSESDAVKVVQKCLDLGLNYIDTANGYSTSEERIGKAVKGRRKDVIIATKTFPGTPETIEKNLELSLKRLDTDYIDLYQFHGVNNKETLDRILDPENGLYKQFEKVKKAGKIRHIGITSHQMDAAKMEVKTGKFETIMFPFNVITSEPAKELLPLCKQHDVGFIVMKPLAGGMLNNANICFKYLMQFPDVVSIPGIEKIHEIEEIYKIYESPKKMTAAEKTETKRMIEELGRQILPPLRLLPAVPARNTDFHGDDLPDFCEAATAGLVPEEPDDDRANGESRHVHRVRRVRNEMPFRAADTGNDQGKLHDV